MHATLNRKIRAKLLTKMKRVCLPLSVENATLSIRKSTGAFGTISQDAIDARRVAFQMTKWWTEDARLTQASVFTLFARYNEPRSIGALRLELCTSQESFAHQEQCADPPGYTNVHCISRRRPALSVHTFVSSRNAMCILLGRGTKWSQRTGSKCFESVNFIHLQLFSMFGLTALHVPCATATLNCSD